MTQCTKIPIADYGFLFKKLPFKRPLDTGGEQYKQAIRTQQRVTTTA